MLHCDLEILNNFKLEPGFSKSGGTYSLHVQGSRKVHVPCLLLPYSQVYEDDGDGHEYKTLVEILQRL